MSRFERDFDAAGDVSPGAVPSDQRDAIACYLSTGEGWSQALRALHGAFAAEAAAKPAAQDKHDINHRASEYLQGPALKSAATDND